MIEHLVAPHHPDNLGETEEGKGFRSSLDMMPDTLLEEARQARQEADGIPENVGSNYDEAPFGF